MRIVFLPEIYNLCVSFKEWIEDGPRGGKKEENKTKHSCDVARHLPTDIADVEIRKKN